MDDYSQRFEAANECRGVIMLRVQTQELDGALICRLEGRFTREGAEEVRRLVTRCDSKLELVVDLTDMMFIDTIGKMCFCLSRGSEPSSLPRLRILGTCANGFSSRLVGTQKRNAHVSSNSNGNGHRPA